MIETKNIFKSFDDNDVLKDISVSFSPGKVNIVIGASGCGKSVFMKCMVGLIKPDSGEVLYEGEDFLKMNHSEQKKLCQQIGMLFQASALFDSLTTEANVAFPLKMFSNMTIGEIQKRVDFCLDRVGLEGKNKLMPSELSGGMKKRVGIARAIALNPKYLFCDEPNSGLDPQNAIMIDNLIKEITIEFNTTTIVNSHDMHSLFESGDFMMFLHEGNKWWEGDPKDIRESDNEILHQFIYASKYMRENFK